MSGPRPVALVTGGSRGIGRAICHELGRSHHVLVGGTRQASVAEVVAALDSAAAFVADLTDADATARACAGVDRLDVLVHSAGIFAAGGSVREQWRQVLELNVVAVVDLTERLLEPLRASRGMVVAINSGSGHRAGPGDGLYPASKFALRAWTDALRGREMGRVRVTSIHPGRVDTDMQQAVVAARGEAYDAGRYLRADAVAAAVRLAVDTDPRGQIDELTIRPFH